MGWFACKARSAHGTHHRIWGARHLVRGKHLTPSPCGAFPDRFQWVSLRHRGERRRQPHGPGLSRRNQARWHSRCMAGSQCLASSAQLSRSRGSQGTPAGTGRPCGTKRGYKHQHSLRCWTRSRWFVKRMDSRIAASAAAGPSCRSGDRGAGLRGSHLHRRWAQQRYISEHRVLQWM